MTAPAPPAANTWDVQLLEDTVRDRLRGNPGDNDEGRIPRCVAVAIDDVDQFLDRCPPDEEADPPEEAFDAGGVAALFEAAVDRAVDLIQANDDSTDIAAADSLERMRARVLSRKARWGIA